jgi:dihydrofolate reductase
MSQVICNLGVSLDGYLAGPNQSVDNPMGEGGMRLHEWRFPLTTPEDTRMVEEIVAGFGAFIMGRNMFGGGRGPWEGSWRGWWGEDPPYHAPVFVLTNYPHEPLVMEGGTTFHFVTDGPESAMKQAREAAGDKNISIAGGANTVQQYLRLGLLDELNLHIAPVLLGAGERLLENAGDPKLEPVRVLASPGVTHIRYRVVH